MKTGKMLTVALLMLTVALSAQESKKSVIPLIGSPAPAFKAETTNGMINFPDDFGSSWKILFSHPQDFTPVCTTEILELARLQKEFNSLGVRIAVISTDTKLRHTMWKNSIEELLRNEADHTRILFPLIEDPRAVVSKLYGMLHEPASTTEDVRGVFVISPDNQVEATFFYPMTVGRNMAEVLRMVEALQTAYTTDLMTPVNWTPGGDLLVPYSPYSDADLQANPGLAEQYYQQGSFLWYKKSKP